MGDGRTEGDGDMGSRRPGVVAREMSEPQASLARAMGWISISGGSAGARSEVMSCNQSWVCVFEECMRGVVEGEELDLNPMSFFISSLFFCFFIRF